MVETAAMNVSLDKQTKISIGLLLAMLAMVSPLVVLFWTTRTEVQDLAWQIQSNDKATAGDIKALTVRLDAMIAQLEEAKDERYRMTNASEDALRMAMENPGLRVPDPRNPGRVLVTRGGLRVEREDG